MKRVLLALGFVGALAVTAAPAHAQGFTRPLRRDLQEAIKDVPRSYLPPPGMCRIWLDGVPPGQQPAPTDCASAVRNRPSNAKVIFGKDEKDDDGKSPPKKDDDKDKDKKDEERKRKKP